MSERALLSTPDTPQDDSGSKHTSSTIIDSMDHGQEHSTTSAGHAPQPSQPAVVSASPSQPHEGPPGQQSAGHTPGSPQPQVQQMAPPQSGSVARQPTPILIASTISQYRPPHDGNGQSHPPMITSDHPIASPRPTTMTQIERLEAEKLEDSPTRRGSTPGHQDHPPIPRLPHRAFTDSGLTRVGSRRSGIDWIVPVDERKDLPPRPRTLGERLEKTVTHAKAECEKYALRAKMTAYALNIAIGLQVLLGALTTAIAAATSGKQTSIAISTLGGLTTLVASYLARARGSNEPELSITRVKDLEQFQRECEAFIMDHGHKVEESGPLADRLQALRSRFEDLLGNASGERKLAPPV